jgi:hypothetical protein
VTGHGRSGSPRSGYAPIMTEPKDDTVRSLIVAAHDEILSEPAETDEKRSQVASE